MASSSSSCRIPPAFGHGDIDLAMDQLLARNSNILDIVNRLSDLREAKQSLRAIASVSIVDEETRNDAGNSRISPSTGRQLSSRRFFPPMPPCPHTYFVKYTFKNVPINLDIQLEWNEIPILFHKTPPCPTSALDYEDVKEFLTQYKILRPEAALPHLEAWAEALAGVESILGKCEALYLSVTKHNAAIQAWLRPDLEWEEAHTLRSLNNYSEHKFEIAPALSSAVFTMSNLFDVDKCRTTRSGRALLAMLAELRGASRKEEITTIPNDDQDDDDNDAYFVSPASSPTTDNIRRYVREDSSSSSSF